MDLGLGGVGRGQGVNVALHLCEVRPTTHYLLRLLATSYLCEVLARRDDVELVAVHDCEQLLAHILRTPHRASLDEVLEAPRVGELGVGPRLADGWGEAQG